MHMPEGAPGVLPSIWAGNGGTGAPVGATNPADRTWYMQALGIWSRALDQNEIGSVMDLYSDPEPHHLPSCIAFFPLMRNMKNVVRENTKNLGPFDDVLSPVGNAVFGESTVEFGSIEWSPLAGTS